MATVPPPGDVPWQVSDLLGRLERVKRSGEGWTARCPAHEDRSPSLSVGVGGDGRVLVKCHAGCDTAAVLAELGLAPRDLFPEQPAENGSRRIVARYPYVDEQGELVFEAVRFEPKGFAQRRPDDSGGWAWNLRGARRVLYRLPAVVAATGTVYVCEGEKDVHALEAVGLVATTSPMGAGKWRDEYAESLRGAGRVVVLADDDEEGRAHAEQVAGSLAGAAADVRVVDLWGGGDTKRDVADWIALAENDAELEQARLLLEQIVDATPPWRPTEASSTADEGDPGGSEFSGLRFAPIAEFVAVDEASAEPLLGDEDDTVLAAGGSVVFYGDGGAGKTTLEADLVVHLAAGAPWLGLPVPRRARVLVIENEGPRGKFRFKLRRKLAAWEGPNVDEWILVLEEPWSVFSFAEQRHREALGAFIAEQEIDVIAAGPVQRLGMEGGGTPDEVGAFMLTIELLRAQLERPLGVLLIHHENKSGDVSGAWEGVTDTLAHVQAQGNGATRVYWRKVRWGKTLHEAAWKLLWRDCESFERDETAERTDADIADALIRFARENPGTSWNRVDNHVEGKAERKRAVRDKLLEEGLLVNAGSGSNFKLYAADDPVLNEVRPAGDALGTHPASATGSPGESAGASRVPPIRGTQETGRNSGEPGDEPEGDELA